MQQSKRQVILYWLGGQVGPHGKEYRSEVSSSTLVAEDGDFEVQASERKPMKVSTRYMLLVFRDCKFSIKLVTIKVIDTEFGASTSAAEIEEREFVDNESEDPTKEGQEREFQDSSQDGQVSAGDDFNGKYETETASSQCSGDVEGHSDVNDLESDGNEYFRKPMRPSERFMILAFRDGTLDLTRIN